MRAALPATRHVAHAPVTALRMGSCARAAWGPLQACLELRMLAERRAKTEERQEVHPCQLGLPLGDVQMLDQDPYVDWGIWPSLRGLHHTSKADGQCVGDSGATAAGCRQHAARQQISSIA